MGYMVKMFVCTALELGGNPVYTHSEFWSIHLYPTLILLVRSFLLEDCLTVQSHTHEKYGRNLGILYYTYMFHWLSSQFTSSFVLFFVYKLYMCCEITLTS